MTLEELAAKLGAEFQGQADLKLTCSCGLDSLQKGGLAYVTGSGGIGNVPVPAELDRSLRKAPEENVGKETALIVPLNYEPRTGNLIFAEDPLDMHVKATRLLHPPLIPRLGSRRSAPPPSFPHLPPSNCRRSLASSILIHLQTSVR